MHNKLVLLSAIIGISFGLQLTPASYSPCLTPTTIQNIDVTPCDAEPCKFTKGTGYKILANFIPHEDSTNCVVEMSGQIGGGFVQVLKKEVCGNGLNCPLSSGANNLLTFEDIVDDVLPDGQTLTRWKLLCDNSATEVFCADVTVLIN